jgi:predicted ATP-grasp superfamily ATP-dependent carboligase
MPAEAAGTTILYSARTIRCVDDIAWPAYALDRPRPGTRIAAGAPICTIKAAGADASVVKTTLELRRAYILRLLQKKEEPRGWLFDAAQRQCADETAR